MNVRVMLVDSDVESNDRLTSLLRSYRIETIVVNNAFDSLEYSKGTYYDMIILDCQLIPKGSLNLVLQLKDAVSSCKKNLYNLREIPIIGLLSGSKEDWQVYLKEEMDDYLKKPIEREEIERILHSWFVDYDIVYDTSLTTGELAGLIERSELIQVLEELSYAIENHQFENAESIMYQVAQRRYEKEEVMEQLHKLEEVIFIDGCYEMALIQLYKLIEIVE